MAPLRVTLACCAYDRTEALRTGEPQNEAKHGGDLFANLYTDPARLEGFLRAMTADSAEALRWTKRRWGSASTEETRQLWT